MFNKNKKVDASLFNRIDNLEEEIDNLKEKISSLEEQFFILKKYIKYFREKGCEVIDLENVKDEWFVLYKLDTRATLYIMLNKLDKFRADWIFGILSSIYTDFDNKSYKYVHIGDIQGSEINNGYGSLLMCYLQKEVVKQNFAYIQGKIVSSDWDHIDRLEHFYKKHGFTVKLDHYNKTGDIKWTNKEYEN